MSNNVDLRAYSYNGLDNPIVAHTFSVEEVESHDGASYVFSHTKNDERKEFRFSVSHEEINALDTRLLVDYVVNSALDELEIKRESFGGAGPNGDFYHEIKRFYENRLRTLLSKRRSGDEVDERTAKV